MKVICSKVRPILCDKNTLKLWQLNKRLLSVCFVIKVNQFHRHWCSKFLDTYAMAISILHMECTVTVKLDIKMLKWTPSSILHHKNKMDSLFVYMSLNYVSLFLICILSSPSSLTVILPSITVPRWHYLGILKMIPSCWNLPKYFHPVMFYLSCHILLFPLLKGKNLLKECCALVLGL